MCSIIMQLEQVMASHNVKLAIINGLKVYELSSLNLPYIGKGMKTYLFTWMNSMLYLYVFQLYVVDLCL